MSEETVQNTPSKEELIKFFQEQIDVKKVQVELQEINTRMAKARAEELQALNFIANMTNPQANQPAGDIHVLTQEDMDANPELEAAGLKVGDEVMVPKNEEVMEKKPRKLKKENA